MENKPISIMEIKNLIYSIRGKQVMLDSDLASLYQVETKNLNKAVKRNIERFPASFCFQLTEEDVENFEVPNWNLKFELRRKTLSALCFYRTRGRNGFCHTPFRYSG